MLINEVLIEAQMLLDSGVAKYKAAKRLDITHDTFRKAFKDGRLVL